MGAEVFKKGIRWIQGRNSSLSLWHDNWMPTGSLRVLIQGPLTIEDEALKVKDVFGPEGWDWSKHSYCIATGYGVDGGASPWQWVWKLETLSQIKIFLCKCLHNSVGVGECLVRRGINVTGVYPLCQREPKSILHKLRDYEAARFTWYHLGVNESSNFYEGILDFWLERNCTDNRCRVSNKPPWIFVFSFAIWLLWKHRNDVVFKNQDVQPKVYENVLFCALEFQHCRLTPKLSSSRKVVRIRWDKSQSEWFRLNTNGSALESSSRAGCSLSLGMIEGNG
ncbi:uncharacterized protein LOC142607985 [Castanea sativa]|uniref:uncharacterized protein LOC142607985 n=1 Tax=Castanea sativa TaxID=21020 RepID=UPI003F653A82